MVLSKKWRLSWTYVPNLDFDYWRCRCPSWIYNEPEFFHAWATFKFVAWVNQVVTPHCALRIKRFRVRFYLDETFWSDIDKRVDFCLRKEVQELELNCSDEDGNCHGEYYTFGSMWLAHLPQNTHMIRTFTKLRSFHVESLKISGALLEVMLSKCRLLEELCLKWCAGVGSLKIGCSFLKLRYLKIDSFELEILEVSAANLDTFICHEKNMVLVCNNFPSVVQGRFSGVRVQKLIQQFFPWSSQLGKLTLNPIAAGFNPSSILSFAKLKQLIMCITVDYDESLLAWMYLIDACSLLRKFKFVVSISCFRLLTVLWYFYVL
ncbi:hypothetical protein Droror1_Dr00023413 [Drosera rotundifolia]